MPTAAWTIDFADAPRDQRRLGRHRRRRRAGTGCRAARRSARRRARRRASARRPARRPRRPDGRTARRARARARCRHGDTLARPIGAERVPSSAVAAARNAHGEPVELEVAGRSVAISSPGKVMFPEHGETKLDLANYYVAVGDALMRTVRRPADAAAAVPERRRRPVVLPEADPGLGAGLAGDDDRRHRQRHRVTGDRDGRPGPRPVGGQPGVPRVPPVAVPGVRPGATSTSCASTSTRRRA